MKLNFETLRSSQNIANELSKDQLKLIGDQVYHCYQIDEDSRAEWKEVIDKAMVIAKQTLDQKNHPWRNAANVKYPLITQAAIDFASRTFPELISSDAVVKGAVIGADPEGIKFAKSLRVSKYMSYQLLRESDEWEDGMDSLLHILPILGTVFKKIYYDPIDKKPVSELCHPEKIVVNYNVKSLECASRITHELTFYANDIISRIRAGIYRDVDIEKLTSAEGYDQDMYDPPLQLLEQHCSLDLDDDGYKEPYIVLIHKQTREVLRIVNRFKKVEKNKSGKIQKIEPNRHFVDYHFLKSPDGGFYSLGLGALLYPLNHAINTLFNQLIDSGTLANTQSGFIGRGVRFKGGEFKAKMGSFTVVDAASGTNIAQNIVPLPTKEPSKTLLELLGALIEIGKDLSANTDVLSGKEKAQNVPATTIMTLAEQGLKVFNAIIKRVYRSQRKEFYKLFELNSKHLKDDKYRKVLDDPQASVKDDFDLESVDVVPLADPSMATDAQRLAKAEAIMSLTTIDKAVAERYFLETLHLSEDDITRLQPPKDPNAPPPPDVDKLLAEAEKYRAQAKLAQIDGTMKSQQGLFDVERLKLDAGMNKQQIEESKARIWKMEKDAQEGASKVGLAHTKATHEMTMDKVSKIHEGQKDEVELSIDTIKAVADLEKVKQSSKEDKKNDSKSDK